MKDVTEFLRNQLLRHEGLRLHPYADTGGALTIGVGRNLTAVGISHEEAMSLLEHDMAACLADLSTFPWFAGLTEGRQLALLDLRFNLGPAGFRTFKKMIAAIERSDWGAAAAELQSSRWATQVQPARVRALTQELLGTSDWKVAEEG